MKKVLSVVVSVYNEEQALSMFYETTKPILENLDWDYELVFVNDGSKDRSAEILRDLAQNDQKVKVIYFSRNFGHESAMIAGIDYASGDAIVCMDADLQHPPQCLPAIIEKLEEGCGVISMVRTKNRSAGLIKNITSAGFYALINALSDVKFEPNASDFLPSQDRRGMCFGKITARRCVFCADMCRASDLSRESSSTRRRTAWQVTVNTVSENCLHFR